LNRYADLPVLPSLPTRRSSDLVNAPIIRGNCRGKRNHNIHGFACFPGRNDIFFTAMLSFAGKTATLNYPPLIVFNGCLKLRIFWDRAYLTMVDHTIVSGLS